MSIFGNIMSAIFGNSAQAQAGGAQGQPGGGVSSPGTAPSITPEAAGAPMSNVDVGATLDNLAKQKKEKLDWRHSIVDLMKLLDLDSSLAARKELATELNYRGDMSDSARMNIWLHKQVMVKLAANGGKVPADLKD
jgi:Domain of unknown function (DUF3597)